MAAPGGIFQGNALTVLWIGDDEYQYVTATIWVVGTYVPLGLVVILLTIDSTGVLPICKTFVLHCPTPRKT